MFFTCVAARRNSRPSPSRSSNQSRASHSTQVRLRLPADACSTAAAPSRVPKYHTASTSSCSASTSASSSFAPVTMLITPAGTSEASSTVESSAAASGSLSEGTATTVFPTATAGATSDTNPRSGGASGQATPTTPIGSCIASVTPLQRHIVHRAVVLVGPRGVAEQPGNARLDLAPGGGLVPAREGREPRRELVRALREVLGEIVEHLRAGVAARARPGGGRVGRFDRVADVLAVPQGHFAERRPVGRRDPARVGRIGPHLPPADEQLVRAIDRGKGRCGNRARCAAVRRRRRLPARASRLPLEVLPHPLPPALAA